MTPKQIRQAEQHLTEWRTTHPDAASVRDAYRRKIPAFTLNSMALENEPVNPERLATLLQQRAP
ncbi:MAG TPA: hypothetical protein VI457_00310 [Methylococcaceae bacterium]|nr:hypothetical protein [Methylococcaceae bacterium]